MILLDLYCGVGGAARGYQMAGHYVVGVDKEPQPDYCGDEFVQADALEFAKEYGHKFQVWHASPPCQASTNLTKGTNAGREYPQLIPQTRDVLAAHYGPTILENVPGAAVRRDLTLCGEMFGLGVIRHRYFELNWRVEQPVHVRHRGRVSGMRHGEWFTGPYTAVYGEGGGKGSVVQWQRAMGIDWTGNRKSIAEAIPPAYTEFIGGLL
jgi:hypothetical protein